MSFPDIVNDVSAPIDPNWEDFLSHLSKGDSFTIKVKEHIHAIYLAAKSMELRITHRDRPSYIRVWRIN